ncbi:MAG: cobalamin-independent methionine synthase II family protein [Chloroflexota bacterium]|nr:cobalamin-independent methionine synthase II family protein [Chloroflexota bacterium]MDE2968921.1 cobalamin-independent methionine synthase II family protein [Chloroflexota bacterium]
MIRSTDRIRVMHAGTLPRPQELFNMTLAKMLGRQVDEAALSQLVREVVRENVGLQIETGIDSVGDGEVAKFSFTHYIGERLGGIEMRRPKEGAAPYGVNGRDEQEFPGYFDGKPGFTGAGSNPAHFVVGPLTYTGAAALQADIDIFNAGLEGYSPEETFLPAATPGTIEHWLANEYYPTDEAFLFALADALHEEYKGIVDAGFLLQIDDPDLPDAWQMFPDMTVAEYRKFAELRIDALNHALRDIPEESIRFHTCWGSYKGPHLYDIPLADIVDLILKVKAVGYSIEASNVVHEHEWTVWRDVKLPDGKVLIPGVVGHASDFIEHPQLVAQRLLRYADLVGKENLMAGTDCGIGARVGHPKVCWQKFRAMSEGARIASAELWG